MMFVFQGEAFAPPAREERKELLTPKERVDVSRIFMGIANTYREFETQFNDAKKHGDIERMRKTETEIKALALANLQKGFFKDESGSFRLINPYINYADLRLDEGTRSVLTKLTTIANDARATMNIRESSIPAVIHETPIEEKITRHVIVNLEYQTPSAEDAEKSPLFTGELKPKAYKIEETHVITEPVALVSIGSLLRDLAMGEDIEKMAQDPDFARSQQFQQLRVAYTAGTPEEVHKRFEQLKKDENFGPYAEVLDVVEKKALKRFEVRERAQTPSLESEPAFTELAKLNLNEPPTQEKVARFSSVIEEFRKLAEEDTRYASQKDKIEALAEKYEKVLRVWQMLYTPGFREACDNVKYTADDVGIHVTVMELMLNKTAVEDVVRKLSKETRERLDKEPNQNITKIINAYEHPSPTTTEKMSEELSLKPDLSSGELTLTATPKEVDKMLADETPQSQKFKV